MIRSSPAFQRLRVAGSLRLGACIVAVAASSLVSSAADWQSLMDNSPFGQAPRAPTNESPSGELEFRGMVQEEDVTLVNVFNSSTQKSQWIPLNGESGGIAAQSYDPASGRLQVTMGGRSLSLGLKQAKVALVQAAPPVAVVAGPPEGGQQNPRDARRQAREGQGAPSGEEAKQAFNNLPPEARAMIDEIRRRRALRSQAAQNGGATNTNAIRPTNSQP